ncbi:MAG TPA: ABC transporter ATP-binding protein [Polyangiales bacterium]|nr:ABC transporter ATP-binding protein [Polyangiales bacterium]
MTPLLEAQGIRHLYEDGAHSFEALRHVMLAVLPGELVFLLGPSGSGQTTLLQILGGLLSPTEGSVRLADQPLSTLDHDGRARARLAHFGFVFQAYNLFPMLTAVENVAVALDLLGVRGREARARAHELLGEVGLADRADRYPSQLSGGQRQRVAIARALANDPQLILADEPTAALDSASGAAVMALFRGMAARGRGVLIVTHDNRILHHGDRIITMADGRIVETRSRDRGTTP